MKFYVEYKKESSIINLSPLHFFGFQKNETICVKYPTLHHGLSKIGEVIVDKLLKEIPMNSMQFKVSKWLQDLPLSSESNCSYFDNRRSRSKMFRLEGDLSAEFFEITLAQGYRRCGDTYYRFGCKSCSLCLSYRILIPRFEPSRSQRRVLNRNKDVDFKVGIPEKNSAKEDLYLRYQYEQHYQKSFGKSPKKPFNESDLLETMNYQMYTNPQLTREIEFYLSNRLIGFGTIDIGVQSVSAVYFVFDPKYSQRSLGTLAILRGIQWATSENYSYYYLGFYIPNHPKMDYKKKFQKAEYLNPFEGNWEDFLQNSVDMDTLYGESN